MSEHLASSRISMWAMGDRTVEEEQHVQHCAACAAEVARLETALSRFRGSVRHWSEQQGGSAESGLFASAPPWDRLRFPWLRLATAAAVLSLVGLAPVHLGPPRPQKVEMLAEADTRLLEQVDAEVSRAVPRPMEPLLRLVTWEPASAVTGAEGKEIHENHQ